MFDVKKLDTTNLPHSFNHFLNKCKDEGINNNSSIKALKLNSFERSAWWYVADGTVIHSISGCYPCPIFKNNWWRILFRSATLKAYRGKAGIFSKSLQHEFCWSKILPKQVHWAQANGGKRFYFTTNSSVDGDAHSFRTNRFMESVFEPNGIITSLEKNKSFYGVPQNLWELVVQS